MREDLLYVIGTALFVSGAYSLAGWPAGVMATGFTFMMPIVLSAVGKR